MMKQVSLAFGLLLLSLTGCYRSQKSYESNVQTQIEWAYQLIDEGQYTESINVFNSVLQTSNSPTARIGLASAYAARAGIKVQSYWDLILPSVRSTPPSQFESTEQLKQAWSRRKEQLSPEWKEKLSSRSEDFFRANDQMEIIRWRFQQIPLLKSESQYQDLLSAREVIVGIPSKGARLYRALLGLIVLKYESNLSAQVLRESMEALPLESQQAWPCSTSVRKWLWSLPPSLNLIGDILNDLKYAYPNKAKDISPFERDFGLFHSQVQSTLQNWNESQCPQP